MRRVIAALVVALLAIALITPAAQAAVSSPRAGETGAYGAWWHELLATAWAILAGVDTASPADSVANSAATNAGRRPGPGPTMDPAGATAPPNSPDLGPTMDPNG